MHINIPDFDKSEPAILYLPGMEGTGKLLYRISPYLPEGYAPIAASYSQELPFDWKTAINDLDSVMRVADPDNLIIIAESFGAAMFMEWAAGSGWPGKVVFQGAFASWPMTRFYRTVLPLHKFVPNGLYAMGRRISLRLYMGPCLTRNERRECFQHIGRIPKEVSMSRAEMIKWYDVRPLLPYLKIQPLFCWGSHDRVVSSKREIRDFKKAFPDAEYKIIPRGGHYSFFDVPQAAAEAFNPFILKK
jgi:pimeloyl-ACP methyl ester carboxylesterase